MAANGSSTATMSQRDSLSSSQFMSSSISSLSSSIHNPNSPATRNASSQISKIYRQASTLFLTRRLPESLSTILPVITPLVLEDSTTSPAPVASASRTTRIKVWSLYLTILNAIVELESDDGKQAFGGNEWRSLCTKVREGQVWEEVVQNGYGGIEGAVDADVVINLATLLLAHARTQHYNQQRLEAYLAASTQPNLDISDRLQQAGKQLKRGPSPAGSRSGMETPRDLNARVKILELYTLHVLLRNNEWDYAREFITMSEVLDDERREAFLQALQSLQDEQAEQENREAEAQREQEEQLKRDLEESKQRRLEEEERERRRAEDSRRSPPRREPSEVDYGVDDSHSGSINGSTKARSTRESKPTKGPSKATRNGVGHASKPSTGKKVVKNPSVLQRMNAIVINLRKLLEGMAASFQRNPMLLLRFLAFIVAVVIAFGRRDVRERIRRMWDKVRATAGMGVKVSYI